MSLRLQDNDGVFHDRLLRLTVFSSKAFAKTQNEVVENAPKRGNSLFTRHLGLKTWGAEPDEMLNRIKKSHPLWEDRDHARRCRG